MGRDEAKERTEKPRGGKGTTKGEKPQGGIPPGGGKGAPAPKGVTSGNQLAIENFKIQVVNQMKDGTKLCPDFQHGKCKTKGGSCSKGLHRCGAVAVAAIQRASGALGGE